MQQFFAITHRALCLFLPFYLFTCLPFYLFTFLPLSQLSVFKFETTAIAVYGADNESFIVVLL